MFAWWGRVVVRRRWAVLAAGMALAIVGGLWGTGVFGAMVAGGFDDPASDSAKARDRIVAEVGRQDVDAIALYSSTDRTVDDTAFRSAVEQAADRVEQRPEVERVLTYYRTQSPALVSGDKHATYMVVTLRTAGDVDEFEAVKPDLVADGVTTQVGGPTGVFSDINGQVREDIARAEMLSMPVLLILLILVFRSVVAAMMPLLVGGLAIVGAFAVTRVLTYTTDVSIFAINVITLLGLGMAVDYALFVVTRFREELAAGQSVPDAVQRTMLTAGRSVFVAGLTVSMAMSSLLLFPQMFLQSMGFGGMAAVLVAMLAALTVLPALLAILGPRVNALRVPLPRWRRSASPTGGWARIAYAVMRRPVVVMAGTVLVLGLLASPFLRAEFGAADERVLPAGTESRVVSERIDREFPGGGAEHVDVLVSNVQPEAAATFATRIRALPSVVDASVTAQRGESTLISVAYVGDSAGPVARGIVNDIRDLAPPAGAGVLVGGVGAETVDLLDSLADGLPMMALLVAVSTMLLLFLAFGSLVLPIKAVLMNLVSIGASFGAVVWIFQDGHLSGLLGFTSTGDLEASQLILMLAILFGLSTDYEVFLLSRVREEWDAIGDNRRAVATGLQRTGGLITSAALLLVIVIGGFATGGITFIKMIGIGMIIAIIVDATIVRALLVPATMRLLGRANWWLPGPLAKVYRRFGIKESLPAEPVVEREPVLV
jgi:RND superfamily putative drug exporter